MIRKFLWAVFFLTLVSSCSKEPALPMLSSADSLAIAEENVIHRKEMDRFMDEGDDSPFKRDTTIQFTGLKWFPVDVRFRGSSTLHTYSRPETVIVLGTKGEERKQLRYGFFEFLIPGENQKPYLLRLNVYKFMPSDLKRYIQYRNHLSVWFTDSTTGKEPTA